MTTLESLAVAPHLRHLLAYLVENRVLESMPGYDAATLAVSSEDVLAQIQAGDASWERDVPPAIAEVIKGKRLFGWKG